MVVVKAGFVIAQLLFVFGIFGHVAAETSSKLVQIACNRNPTLSFCGGRSSNESTVVSATEPEILMKESEDNKTVNTTFQESAELPDLPTFEQHLVRDVENITFPREASSLPSSAEIDDISSAFADSPTDITGSAERAKFLSAEVDTVIGDDEDDEIPDDPILKEPLPSKKGKQENITSELGSLLRLPKPRRNTQKTFSTTVAPTKFGTELIEPPPLPADFVMKDEGSTALNSQKPPKSNVAPGYVEVYITKYCVDHRKDFLVKCRVQKVAPAEIEFCKSYPFNCTSDEDGVVPLLAYCERFLHDYVKVCAPTTQRDRRGRQFCKAYDQFCVPPPTQADVIESTQAMTRCEEIQPEARKVCNPPPPPSDRLNYGRCVQFHQFCAKYVDWE